jgi:hypothetical protein
MEDLLPFNCRGDKGVENLKRLQDEINQDKDIHVNSLFRVNSQEAEKLNVGAEGTHFFNS